MASRPCRLISSAVCLWGHGDGSSQCASPTPTHIYRRFSHEPRSLSTLEFLPNLSQLGPRMSTIAGTKSWCEKCLATASLLHPGPAIRMHAAVGKEKPLATGGSSSLIHHVVAHKLDLEYLMDLNKAIKHPSMLRHWKGGRPNQRRERVPRLRRLNVLTYSRHLRSQSRVGLSLFNAGKLSVDFLETPALPIRGI